jgi:hypothetical protein
MNAITKPRPHAEAAAACLRDAIRPAHTALRQALEAYRAAYAGFTPDADLLDVMRAAGSIALAAEAITAAAKAAEATARSALAQAMADTGCTAVALEHHTVHLGTRPASVEIEDAAAIPAHLMRAPPPAPDRTAIGKLLRANVAVPGARLIGNHDPVAIFRSNHQ